MGLHHMTQLMQCLGISKGIFTVKSYYLKLLSCSSFAIQAGSFEQFPWKIIWKNLAHLKVSVFVWEASHGSILTCDNLQKKGFFFFC